MANFKCPHCHEETLSLKDKYRMGMWFTAYCANCNSRLAAFPWILMLIHFLYVWNVIWFVALVYFNDGYIYLLYMVIVWGVLDLLNVYYVPLVKLKAKKESG